MEPLFKSVLGKSHGHSDYAGCFFFIAFWSLVIVVVGYTLGSLMF